MMEQIIEFLINDIITLLSSDVIKPFIAIWVVAACVDIIFYILDNSMKWR